MRFDICTLFPDAFTSYFNESIIKRAQDNKQITIHLHNIRDFSEDKHHKVDDTPYGGGPGMLMTPQPIYDCVKKVQKENKGPVIFLRAQGQQFTQTRAKRLSKLKSMILVCGRYEGMDQRVIDLLADEEICIGKYIITGGELAGMVLIDAVSRLIPGVLGEDESSEEESFSRKLSGKKEYPQYTRPVKFKGLEVPHVLRSGNHKEIEKWRRNKLK